MAELERVKVAIDLPKELAALRQQSESILMALAVMDDAQREPFSQALKEIGQLLQNGEPSKSRAAVYETSAPELSASNIGASALQQEIRERILGFDAYKRIGYTIRRELPEITLELITRCLEAPVKSMLVLDMGLTISDLKSRYMKALPNGIVSNIRIGETVKKDDRVYDYKGPEWIVLPMEVDRALTFKDGEVLRRGKVAEVILPDARQLATGIILFAAQKNSLLFADDRAACNNRICVGFEGSNSLQIYEPSLLSIFASEVAPLPG